MDGYLLQPQAESVFRACVSAFVLHWIDYWQQKRVKKMVQNRVALFVGLDTSSDKEGFIHTPHT